MNSGRDRARRLILLACLSAGLLVLPAAAPAATVKSTFDSSLEGWTVFGDPASGSPSWVATGGNPGGFARTVDRGSGTTMYWQAPSRFMNLRKSAALYGGELRFDLRQSVLTSQYDDADVVLVGFGHSLRFNTPRNPGVGWTSYRVPLTENGWTWVTGGKKATAKEINDTLMHLDAIRIRAEYVSGGDTDDLDNVILTSGSGSVPPPEPGKSVVANVVSGVVFVSVPKGKSIKRGRKSVVATTAKFRRYRGKANIPVGSLIDTRKGRIAITAASDRKGGTQDGEFYDGVFQIKQAKAAKVTDALLLTSRAGCGKGSARTSARKKKLGRLWATAKGRFRTRGRFSAASVRGTTWLTEERCDGTFTKVSRGKVAVRDKLKKKTIILTAGQSYFARAQRASQKS